MPQLILVVLVGTLLGGAIWAGPGLSQPLDTRSARQMLFPAKGFSVQYPKDNGLTELQRSYFEILVGSAETKAKFAELARYYGSIALTPSMFERSPAELMANPSGVPFQVSTAYHSPPAADRAALRDCEALRSAEERPCVIAARILPKRYKPRALHMSVAATSAFAAYRKMKGARAFALSPSTPAFGFAGGEFAVEDALRTCKAAVAGGACNIVIRDGK